MRRARVFYEENSAPQNKEMRRAGFEPANPHGHSFSRRARCRSATFAIPFLYRMLLFLEQHMSSQDDNMLLFLEQHM